MNRPLRQLALLSLVVLLCFVFQLLMIDVPPAHAQGSASTATTTSKNSDLIELETRQHAN